MLIILTSGVTAWMTSAQVKGISGGRRLRPYRFVISAVWNIVEHDPSPLLEMKKKMRHQLSCTYYCGSG